MNNNYQFRFDGSPEAKEAIRLINETCSKSYKGLPGTYYNNSGSDTKSYMIPKHDLLTPAEFVARMKGEREQHQYKMGEWIPVEKNLPAPQTRVLVLTSYGAMDVCRLTSSDDLKKVWVNDLRPQHSNGSVVAWSKLPEVKLTLTDRICHAYPSLSERDVEQIVKMVKDEK